MSTRIKRTPDRIAGLSPFEIGLVEPQSNQTDATRAQIDNEQCVRGICRLFSHALSRADEVGCVDWYQYPSALAPEGSGSAGVARPAAGARQRLAAARV